MLLGQQIRMFMDHKKLAYPETKFSNNHALRQRLLLKEYAPEIPWLAGKKNVATDTMS